MEANITATTCHIAMPGSKRVNLDASFPYRGHQWLGSESAAARRGTGVI